MYNKELPVSSTARPVARTFYGEGGREGASKRNGGLFLSREVKFQRFP
jgi:hypothetical protein